MTVIEVVVVGGGPAGMACAIQLHRADVDVLLLERDRPGGLLRTAMLVENYPGFARGISGRELAELMAAQMKRLRVGWRRTEVSGVEPCDDGFMVATAGDEIRARRLVLATGTRSRRLGLPHEEGLRRSRLLVDRSDLIEDAAWDGAEVAIIGGGDAALDQALRITALGARARIFMRSPLSRALPLLERRVHEHSIPVISSARLESLERHEDRLALVVERRGIRESVMSDRVMACIGRVPELACLDGLALEGTDDINGRTSVDGCYLVGDVRRGICRQVSTAVGDGMAAAMDIMRGLAQKP